MRSDLRERLNRVLLKAFLDSDFKNDEIKKISKDISSDAEFCSDFANLLNDVVMLMSGNAQQNKNSRFLYKSDYPEKKNSSDSETVNQLINIVKNKKITKSRVFEIMNYISPGMVSMELSLQDMINIFYENSSVRQINNFLDSIGRPDIGDGYLKGITNRS